MRCSSSHRSLRVRVAVLILVLAGCTSGPTPSPSPVVPQTSVASQAVAPKPALLPCVSLNEFKNTWTPEDSFSRMQDCIAKGDLEKAADLDTMALIYGNYDTWRVADEDVKNGFTVLTYLTYQNIGDSQRGDLAATSARRIKPGSASAKALCQKAQQIGPPGYVPLYMTKYRIDDAGRNVVGPAAPQVYQSPSFDIARQWQQAVDAVLHCSKQ